jgi:hypothetical protein
MKSEKREQLIQYLSNFITKERLNLLYKNLG